MDGSDVPTLEVGFSIDTGMSESELVHLQATMDSTEAKIVAEAASIEKATSGMVRTDAAVAGITSFGNATTKVAQDARREFAKIEKSGEGLIKSLERQSAAYGLTREELRRLKVEQAAADAERVGNTDLANRLRAAEGELYDKEFAAMRRNRAEAESLAEDRAADAQRAAAAAELEAKALREARRGGQAARIRAHRLDPDGRGPGEPHQMTAEANRALLDRQRATEALLAACAACILMPARAPRTPKRKTMKRSLS